MVPPLAVMLKAPWAASPVIVMDPDHEFGDLGAGHEPENHPNNDPTAFCGHATAIRMELRKSPVRLARRPRRESLVIRSRILANWAGASLGSLRSGRAGGCSRLRFLEARSSH